MRSFNESECWWINNQIQTYCARTPKKEWRNSWIGLYSYNCAIPVLVLLLLTSFYFCREASRVFTNLLISSPTLSQQQRLSTNLGSPNLTTEKKFQEKLSFIGHWDTKMLYNSSNTSRMGTTSTSCWRIAAGSHWYTCWRHVARWRSQKHVTTCLPCVTGWNTSIARTSSTEISN